MSRRNLCGFTRVETAAVGVILGVLAAMLYPIFAKGDQIPDAILLDGNGRPIPHAVLAFREESGGIAYQHETSDSGSFFERELPRLIKLSARPYYLTRKIGRSRGASTYVFSPLVPQTAHFHFPDGRPLRMCKVFPEPHWERPGSLAASPQTTTDTDGNLNLGVQPSLLRFEFSPHFVKPGVENVRTSVASDAVHYDVTVEPPASLVGRVDVAGLRARNLPTRNLQVQIEQSDANAAHETGAVRSLAQREDVTVAEDGVFRATDLPSGAYTIRLVRAGAFVPPLATGAVTLGVGEAKRITLRP